MPEPQPPDARFPCPHRPETASPPSPQCRSFPSGHPHRPASTQPAPAAPPAETAKSHTSHRQCDSHSPYPDCRDASTAACTPHPSEPAAGKPRARSRRDLQRPASSSRKLCPNLLAPLISSHPRTAALSIRYENPPHHEFLTRRNRRHCVRFFFRSLLRRLAIRTHTRNYGRFQAHAQHLVQRHLSLFTFLFQTRDQVRFRASPQAGRLDIDAKLPECCSDSHQLNRSSRRVISIRVLRSFSDLDCELLQLVSQLRNS